MNNTSLRLDNNTIKQREAWIDWMKTTLIYLVVVGHSAINGLPSQLIYMFHVPAFFIISGYLYKHNSLYKTAKRLLFPTVLYAIINFPYNYAYYTYKGGKDDIADIIANMVCSFYMYGGFKLYAGAWFVLVLFYIRFVSRDYKWNIVLMGFSLFFISIYVKNGCWFEKSLFYRMLLCMPFFYFGYVLKQHKAIFVISKKVPLSILCFFTIWGGITNGIVDIADLKLGNNTPLFYIVAVFSFCVLVSFYAKVRSNKYIETVSNGTLLVLCIHGPLTDIIMQVGRVIDPSCYITPWLCGLVILFFSYFAIKFATRYCPMLLGK